MMKILVFTDTHGSLQPIRKVKREAKKHHPDLILFAGDLTMFGEDMKQNMRELDKLQQEVLVIHGNHETATEMRKACAKTQYVKFFHNRMRNLNKDFLLMGFSVEGFGFKDPAFEKFVKRKKHRMKNKRVILLSHAPPYNSRLDLVMGQHYGNKSLRKFIDKHHPVLVVCGHLHENFNKRQRLGKTRVINPGPTGKLLNIS